MGTFMRALRVIGLERGLDRLAADDDLRRKLQNFELFGPRHDAAQPGTEKRLPNKAVFSYRLLLSNVKLRALRQNDAPPAMGLLALHLHQRPVASHLRAVSRLMAAAFAAYASQARASR